MADDVVLAKGESEVAAARKIREMLTMGFAWDKTPQGFAYWEGVVRELYAVEQHFKRKVKK